MLLLLLLLLLLLYHLPQAFCIYVVCCCYNFVVGIGAAVALSIAGNRLYLILRIYFDGLKLPMHVGNIRVEETMLQIFFLVLK